MIITKESEVFQKLLKDVEYIKDAMNLSKYYAGVDPYVEKKPLFKAGDWVIRTEDNDNFEKDEPNHRIGRIFRIQNILGVRIEEAGGITHWDCFLRLATKEEIKDHLVREAIKRGLVAYGKFKWIGEGEREDITTIMPNYGYEYLSDLDVLVVEVKESTSRRAVYRNGKWAVVVVDKKLPCSALELEQVLREFGRVIYASDYLGEMNNEIEKFLRAKGYK